MRERIKKQILKEAKKAENSKLDLDNKMIDKMTLFISKALFKKKEA